MTTTPTPLSAPHRVAAARRVITCHPADTALQLDCWFLLKEAQGHPITRRQLARLRGDTHPTAARNAQLAELARADGRNPIDLFRRAAAPRLVEVLTRLTTPNGGDAA